MQLLNERRARQAAEAMYRDQKATMDRMAAESKLSMDKLTERSAAELRQAKDALAAELRQAKDALGAELRQAKEALAAEAKQAKAAVELRHARDAMAAELKQAKEALQSASAAHALEVSRLLQQLPQASEARKLAPVEEPPTAVPVPVGASESASGADPTVSFFCVFLTVAERDFFFRSSLCV